ncbi:unnamed protein product [Adineta steineri]|uniref:Innexin n=1 Tax=Adineta steineri TaxID=433720 RepID=A0A814ZJA0_9BILA|nr:unnamed protein product [Adineta steineri]
MDILCLIRRLPEIVAYNKFDDDLFDRLNYSHTVAILIVFAIIVTNRQFSDNQIKCWVPAQFTGGYEQYVNQICFITNTYSFDMHETLPDDYSQRHDHELKYYQWTPFILLLMAILFYIPHKFWRGLSLRSGVDLKDLIEAAQTYRSSNIRHDDKIKLLAYLTNWVDGYCSNIYRLKILDSRKSPRTCIAKLKRFVRRYIFRMGRYTGKYLIRSYLFIKFLYLFNSIGQIFLLNVLLGRNYWLYGIELIYRYWTQNIGLLAAGNEYFPKVVLCDFTIREPNHPKESHRYTVQCVLPFNLFNQQIFTYLYFWLVILSCFNIVSILIWCYRMNSSHNFHYLERRLKFHFLTDENHKATDDSKRHFVHKYLQGDGTFMLHLVTSNVSDYVCRKILLGLYNTFYESLGAHTIGREPLFKPISMEKFDDDDNTREDENKKQNDDNENDENTNQTIASDIPPIPNPRHGKVFIESNTNSKLQLDQTDSEPTESKHTDSSSILLNTTNGQIRLRSSITPLLKDIRRTSEIQPDSTATTPRYKNVDFHLESDTALLSTLSSPSVPSHSPPLPPPPPPPPHPPPPFPVLFQSSIKGPSPYATTYLTARKRSEHELPYIDDSISSGSTSTRLTSMNVAREPDKPKTLLKPSNVFFRRSHDV